MDEGRNNQSEITQNQKERCRVFSNCGYYL